MVSSGSRWSSAPMRPAGTWTRRSPCPASRHWCCASRRMLEEEILPDYLPKHRWFAGKDRRIDKVAIERVLRVPATTGSDPWLLALLTVRQNEQPVRYQLPLAVDWRESMLKPGSPLLPWTLAKTR